MNNNTVLITGSTGGIGYGIAECFAKAGYSVLLHGLLTKQEGEKIASDLSTKTRAKVLYEYADLKNKNEVASLVSNGEKLLGGISVLINNAGMQKTSRVEDFSDDDWDTVIAIDLSAAFHAIKHSLPHMQKRKYGRIINIASAHGMVGSENKVAYVAAKHGIIGLTKVVALENANNGITCNCICPGWVNTPLVQEQIKSIAKNKGISIEEAQDQLISEKHPMKKFVEIEEIANAAIYLTHAHSMTGASIVLDCGWTSR